MRLSYKQTGVKPVVSVWLDDSYGDIRKQFHCLICGKIAFEYYSNVKIVVPGKAEHQKSPLDIQCKSCKTLYSVE